MRFGVKNKIIRELYAQQWMQEREKNSILYLWIIWAYYSYIPLYSFKCYSRIIPLCTLVSIIPEKMLA